MAKNIEHIQHVKSSVVLEGKPKLPQANQLVEGELAINYAEGVETISIKNASGDIVTFSSDNYYTEQKLGSGFTGENSANTVTSVIEEDERIISASLNDLKENKLDVSAYTPIEVDQVIDSGTSASTNAVATKAVFEVIKEDERVTAEALNSLNTTVIENERVTAEALNSLNTTVEENERVTAEALNYLNETVEEDERVTAEALNYLNANKQDTLSAGTGIIISGNVISSNAVVNIDQVIDSSTSASTGAVSTSAVYGFVTAYTPSITVDQTIDRSTSASTNPVATSAVYDFLTENYYTKDETDDGDEVISASLNDLNTRKLDASAYTPTVEVWLSGTGENSIVQKGTSCAATGIGAIAEGSGCTASGDYSHAEGYSTSASSFGSHAEGGFTLARDSYSHAEGRNSQAQGNNSHAEGWTTTAASMSDHSEGCDTIARGGYSHAEGHASDAKGSTSHAEGEHSIANGIASHGEGWWTETKNKAEHASGQFNKSVTASTTFGHSGNTLFSVGNGAANDARHNAFEIRQNGDIYIVNKNGQDVRLQDEIGNITIDQVIDSGTSASTDAVSTSAVYGFVTSYTPSITVDQILDDSVSASTNPIASKAVYSALTDTEFVWANAYGVISGAVDTISGSVDTHKANTNIHLLQIVSAVTVSSDMSNVTCPNSITGGSNNGAQALVVYENSGSTTDYTITVSTLYKTPDGNQLVLTCPANGYCEVSYVNINGTIYARGI